VKRPFPAPTRPRLALFTDLDGTLLDATTYRYGVTRSALDRLREYTVPVVICTSKTKAEVEPLRKEIGNQDPFIVENGGALYIPDGYFKAPLTGSTGRDGYRVIELGFAYPRVRKALRRIEKMVGATLIGFGDMTVEDIVRVTGLARPDAERARQREYDEPFLVEGSPLSLEGVRKAARQLGLVVISGGRCHHLVGGTDKGRACRRLIELYRKEWGDVTTAGIGDGLNDWPMLQAVDRPFLVERPEGGYVAGVVIEGLTRLRGIGPDGWKKGVGRLLEESAPHPHALS
jgi:mannosyl-3-phosphoglycerate phosphatase